MKTNYYYKSNGSGECETDTNFVLFEPHLCYIKSHKLKALLKQIGINAAIIERHYIKLTAAMAADKLG